MPSTAGSGTVTPVIGTPSTLFNSTATGTFVLKVDTNAMASGDVLELRVYSMVLTGGTTRVAYMQRYTDAQPADDLIKISEPVGVDITDSGAFRATLTQTAGTARAFPWSVVQF